MSFSVPHETFCQVLFLVIDAKLFSAAGNGQKERELLFVIVYGIISTNTDRQIGI